MEYYPASLIPSIVQASLWGSHTPLQSAKAALLFDWQGADAQRELDSNLEMHTMQTKYADLFAGQTVQRVTQARTNDNTRLHLFNFTEEEVFFTKDRELIIDSTVVLTERLRLKNEQPLDIIALRNLWSEDDCSIALLKNRDGDGYLLLDCNSGTETVTLLQINPGINIPLAISCCSK